MKPRPMTAEARAALAKMPDEWTLTPACFSIGPTLEALELAGWAQTRRSRPFPKAPHRISIRRTAKGRAALGLET